MLPLLELVLLDERPARVDMRLLRRYPEYIQFASPGLDCESEDAGVDDDVTSGQTLHETMETAHLRAWHWVFWQL